MPLVHLVNFKMPRRGSVADQLHIEGEQVGMHEGQAVFVPAGAEHRFVGYEQLALLVVFERPR